MIPPRPTWPDDTSIGQPYALLALLQVHWFVRLRWVFAGVTLGVLATERFLLPTVRRPWPLLAAVLGVAAINVVWTWISAHLRRQFRAPAEQQAAIREGQLFVSAQIAVDLLLLTVILALTGGVENPMAVFYLFHVAISGLLLRTWQAAVQSVWAVLLYALMGVLQMTGFWPYWPFLPHLGATELHAQPHYVVIVVVVQALAVFGTLYFTDRIGKVLNQREDMLIRANAALEQSQLAIQDLQQRRSRFMQIAAHQLKSPLAMVQTLANLIRDGVVTDVTGIQNTCERIVRRSRDGIAQVCELLTLARVQEADPRRHAEGRSDVGAVVADLCRKHAPVAQERRMQFDCDLPTGASCLARVQAADLADCVGNLIDNAIKYTPDGGRVLVRVRCGRDAAPADGLPEPPQRPAAPRTVADYVYAIVQDTGMGLSEPILTRAGGTIPDGTIFDAFRRGNAALAAGIPGTGLGLSIVREIVEQAGGYIHVQSRPGQGSTFTVAFPALTAGPPVVRDTRSSEIVVERDRDVPASS